MKTNDPRQPDSAAAPNAEFAPLHDTTHAPLDADPIRPHVFDGNIQEYDKNMPNWWLFCFWGGVAFSLFYWIYAHEWDLQPDPGVALVQQMEESKRLLAKQSGVVNDETLRQLSHDAAVIAAGKATFAATCASCHMADLGGGIGPNLKDTTWIHGGNPLAIVKTITDGVMAKGMPGWGPVLGRQKITEVTAFILSQQTGIPAAPASQPAKVSQADASAIPAIN